MASKPKDRGRWGGWRGASRGQKEKKGDTQRKRGRTRGWEGGRARETRQKNAERGASQSKSVCTMCLYVLEGNNEESMGQNNRPSLPFRPTKNSNPNIHPSSPGAYTPPSFDICFPFLKSLMLLVFETQLSGLLIGSADGNINGFIISDEREQQFLREAAAHLRHKNPTPQERVPVFSCPSRHSRMLQFGKRPLKTQRPLPVINKNQAFL